MTLGTVQMGPEKFRDFVEEISYEYYGDSYHLLYKNCNHFCEDVCRRLLNASLPGWVNRLAKIGCALKPLAKLCPSSFHFALKICFRLIPL
jgi:hypothetical protein